jgi:hypothetical protein
MTILSWEQPKRASDPEAHAARYQSDTGIRGTYVPNMSAEDQARWKAKLIGGPDPRVEIRRRVTPGTLVLLVVYGDNLKLSMNGPARLTDAEWEQMAQAVAEAKRALAHRRQQQRVERGEAGR